MPCQQCTAGQSRNEQGKCRYCPEGTFQPQDFRPQSTRRIGNHIDWLRGKFLDPVESRSNVECESCPAGTFAQKQMVLTQFYTVPREFQKQVCQAVGSETSLLQCESEAAKWHANAGWLEFAKLPPGLRVSLTWNFEVVNPEGGAVEV